MLRGFSFGSLLLVFVIAVVLFGMKRLRDMGSDLGVAVKSFCQGLHQDKQKST